jgi:hypothetical protein
LRFDLENEYRTLEHELGKESDENYSSKMTIFKEKEFD